MLDIRGPLKNGDHLGSSQIRGVGEQRELTIKEFGFGHCVPIDRRAEAVGVEISPQPSLRNSLAGSLDATSTPSV